MAIKFSERIKDTPYLRVKGTTRNVFFNTIIKVMKEDEFEVRLLHGLKPVS